MQHSFNVEAAKQYGILESVLLNFFEFWVQKNEANEKNYHDGYYWTYNSTRAMTELFPYASQRMLQKALQHLKDEGLIITGNYNETAYDRTLWYTLTEKGKSILQNGEVHFTQRGNGFYPEGKPIPVNNTVNNNTVINTVDKETTTRFKKPTVEEVRAYCRERKNKVDPERFVDHYTANGWMVGKHNKMRDWKAAVRTWEKNGLDNRHDLKEEPKAERLDDLDDIF